MKDGPEVWLSALRAQAWNLAFGEAGNFPAAIKATAEYFPKKERSFATGIFKSERRSIYSCFCTKE